MPQPTASDVHVNRPLTNFSSLSIQSSMPASRLAFPIIPSDKQSDAYWKVNSSDFRRRVQGGAKRAPATESKGLGYRVDPDNTFFCAKRSLHHDVADERRRNEDEPLNSDRHATTLVTQALKLEEEADWAAAFMVASTWTGSTTGGDLTGGTDFDKFSEPGSDPIRVIRAQRTSVHKKTGQMPNVMVVGQLVDDAFKEHPAVLSRMSVTSDRIVTNDMLAKVFEVDKYIVANMIETTSAQGAATETTAYVVDDDAILLVYATPNPGPDVPTAGATFVWTAAPGFAAAGATAGTPVIRKYRLEKKDADRIEGTIYYDHKVVDANMGVFFADAADALT